VDIARVYLECGHELTALAWLEKIPAADSFRVADRDSLLLEVYGRSGNLAEQIEVAWRIFRRSRSATSLLHLLDIIGHDKKGSVLAGEIGAILEETMFSPADAVPAWLCRAPWCVISMQAIGPPRCCRP